jgi:hypothetical protein
MLHTGIVPDEFGIGVTAPMPKFKGCKRAVKGLYQLMIIVA